MGADGLKVNVLETEEEKGQSDAREEQQEGGQKLLG
jgi:hypothetical protein